MNLILKEFKKSVSTLYNTATRHGIKSWSLVAGFWEPSFTGIGRYLDTFKNKVSLRMDQ